MPEKIPTHVKMPFPNRVCPRIASLVTAAWNIPQIALIAPVRGSAAEAHVRQVAMYMAHVACGLSLSDVGHMFHRNRSTVAHACARIEDLRDDCRLDSVLTCLELALPIDYCDWH